MTNGVDFSGSIIDAGWVRHAVCAVTRQLCRQALMKKRIVLMRNACWVMQKTLTRILNGAPAFMPGFPSGEIQCLSAGWR
jgi:hypothetical protein